VFDEIVKAQELQPGIIEISQFVSPGNAFTGQGKLARIYFKLKQNSFSEIKIDNTSSLLNTRAENILVDRSSAFVSSSFLAQAPLPATGDIPFISKLGNNTLLISIWGVILISILLIIIAGLKHRHRKLEEFHPI